MLKARNLSLLVGAALVLFCAGSIFAGQPQYKVVDFAAEPEAPESGGVAAANDCFYGDQTLCDTLSQNFDATFASNALRCAADWADVSTGYWRLFDLNQNNSADAPLGFHADVNGTTVTGEFCMGTVNWFSLAKHVNDYDDECDGPGGSPYGPDLPPDECPDGDNDDEGPTDITITAYCLDEGLPFIRQFLGPGTETTFTADCGGAPGTLYYGPQGQHFDDGGLVQNPDAFECFYDPISTPLMHCCDADTQDLAVFIRTHTCCSGGDDGYGGQICGVDTDGDDIISKEEAYDMTTCEFNIAAQNDLGETIPGYLGGGECLSEPVAFGLIGFPSLHLILTVDEYVIPIPATTRIGAVLLVMILLGSSAYYFMRRRVFN